ncbi:Sperm flagellar protein 2, partial [Coelomomyces lativittatus]
MNIRREQVVTSKSKGSSDKSEAKNKRQSSNSVMGNKGSNDEGIDVWLSEFNKAQEAAFSYIQSLEEEEKKFLRDFKSGLRLNDSMESDENNEYIKAIRGEESLLRFRFMRICDVAVENLKEVRNRSIELYSHLDDRIGVNFRGEIAAVKNLVVYVKQAIELELKLPNELCLNGQEFKIDLSYMMFEPEPPPNPPSPKEEL